jgi:hypothetical protein
MKIKINKYTKIFLLAVFLYKPLAYASDVDYDMGGMFDEGEIQSSSPKEKKNKGSTLKNKKNQGNQSKNTNSNLKQKNKSSKNDSNSVKSVKRNKDRKNNNRSNNRRGPGTNAGGINVNINNEKEERKLSTADKIALAIQGGTAAINTSLNAYSTISEIQEHKKENAFRRQNKKNQRSYDGEDSPEE